MTIICHIVGMNNITRQSFLKTIENKYSDIVVVDLDNLTHKINNEHPSSGINKKLLNSNNFNEKKNLAIELRSIWKNKLTNSIKQLESKHNDKNIILLGLSTYVKNHRVRIKIDTGHKFIVSVNLTKNAKNIIEYNINNYKPHIIDGVFPIRYLDHKFWIPEQEKIRDIYKNMGYKLKTYKNLQTWLYSKHNIKTDTEVNENSILGDVLYIGSKNNYDGIITSKKPFRKSKQKLYKFLNKKTKIPVGYRQQWMALLSSIDDVNNHIRKGFIKSDGNMVPFIKERHDGGFVYLDDECYLYKVSESDFDINKIKYKGYANSDIIIKDKIHIQNICDELRKSGVKLFKFKDNLKL